MSDIAYRMRNWTDSEGEPPAGELMALAVDEIERLRAELDACVRTMNTCIADYQKLRQVALDGDTLVAYRLGVQHGSECHAVQQ